MSDKKKCKADNCEKIVFAMSLCSAHYSRLKRYGDYNKLLRRENGSGYIDKRSKSVWLYKPNHPNSSKNGKILAKVFIMSEFIKRPLTSEEKVINIDGDKRNIDISNLKLIKKNKICTIENCNNNCQYYNKYCALHWKRLMAHKNPNIIKKAKKGAGSITAQGYRRIWMPNHPNSNPHGTILEHRYVMSQFLERPLLPGENVHHINGNRLDNRIENLELWKNSQCPGQRVTDLVEWANKIINTYREEYEKLKKNVPKK